MAVKYTISAIAKRTGLTTHTLRAWERRYAALAPARTDTNRRLYDESDVEHLLLLKGLLDEGHSIGQVANLSVEELRSISKVRYRPESPPAKMTAPGSDNPHFKSAVQAVQSLDAARLKDVLARATSVYGAWGLLESVVVPLIHHIEANWQAGSLSVAQEHMASAVLRSQLDEVRASMASPEGAPKILVTTPQGQVHEIGALIVSIVAALQSWDVLYIGPNLPANEIVSAFHRSGADALGLSLVYPLDDPLLPDEMKTIRRGVGPGVPIFVGGRGTEAYADSLEETGAIVETNLAAFQQRLESARTSLADSRN